MTTVVPISPYLRRPVRRFEDVVVGRRVVLNTDGAPPQAGVIQAAVPGRLLVRFRGGPGGDRTEWLPLERLEIVS